MKTLILLLISMSAWAGEHPALGTTLVHFSKVDDGIYKGSRPKNDADFRYLESLHIRYIMDLNFFPLFSIHERRKVRKYGMTFLRVPMNASPIPPSEKHVNEALEILRDSSRHPIYFHCELGRDRTSLVAALYRMYFEGMPQDEAWQQMKADGYKDWFGIRGLKSYFDKHPAPSAALEDQPECGSQNTSCNSPAHFPADVLVTDLHTQTIGQGRAYEHQSDPGNLHQAATGSSAPRPGSGKNDAHRAGVPKISEMVRRIFVPA